MLVEKSMHLLNEIKVTAMPLSRHSFIQMAIKEDTYFSKNNMDFGLRQATPSFRPYPLWEVTAHLNLSLPV